LEYHRNGLLNIPRAAIISAGLFLGSWFGSRIALGIDTVTLQRLYGAFLLYVCWRFTEPLKWYAEHRKRAQTREYAPATRKEKDEEPQVAWYTILALGLVAGVLAGMFGIGGGVVIVPALVGLLHFDQKRAVGTSLGALLPPFSLPAVYEYYQSGDLDLGAALFVAGGLLFGAIVGARIALGLSSTTVKRLYGVFLLLIAFRFMFPEVFLPTG
jgi:hypothetical protein